MFFRLQMRVFNLGNQNEPQMKEIEESPQKEGNSVTSHFKSIEERDNSWNQQHIGMQGQ